jgi:hypothetical protein
MALKTPPIEIANKIIQAAKDNNFRLEVRGGILTIHSNFTGGDVNEWFRNCDMSYYSVLGNLPRTSPGSDFGTDGGSVGGLSAIRSGHFTMNRTGGSVRVLNALKKLM